jgi:hypothetical protein
MATDKIDAPNGRAIVVGPYAERKGVRFIFQNRHQHQGDGDSFAELNVFFCGVPVLHKEDRKFDNSNLSGEFDFVLEKGATASVCFVTRNSGAKEVEVGCSTFATTWP